MKTEAIYKNIKHKPTDRLRTFVRTHLFNQLLKIYFGGVSSNTTVLTAHIVTGLAVLHSSYVHRITFVWSQTAKGF